MNGKLFLVAVVVALLAVTACRADDAPQPQPQARKSEPKYSFENLKSLAIQDIMRWVTIGEDVFAEFISREWLDGILDKKSIKIALRFLVKKAQKIIEQNGLLEAFEQTMQ